MAENLLLRCRMDPRWSSEEIDRLRTLVWLYVDPAQVKPEHADAVNEVAKGKNGDAQG